MRLRTLLFVCLTGTLACDSPPAKPTPTPCTFSSSPAAFSIGADGGSGTITVTTGSQCSWSAKSDVAWITVSGGTSATGTGTVAFTVAAATTAAARTGTLQVGGQTITVQQQALACTYTVQPPARSFDAAGGTGVFDVNTATACTWTAASTPAWLSLVSAGSGSGNATVAYHVDTNSTTAPRTGSVTVGGVAHAVTQSAGCSVDIDRESDTMAVGGGTGTFGVSTSSGCSWTVVSAAAWIRVSDPAGGQATGPRRVTYAVEANPGAAARSGTITVAGRTFTLTQLGAAGCRYEVAPTDVRVCMTAGSGRLVTVTADPGCPWTATATASWISIASGASGAGTGSVALSFGNNFEAARQAMVEVRWPTPTAGQNARMAQAGCLYGVSRDAIDLAAAGGDVSFDVVSSSTDTTCGGPLQNGCVWSATSSASWVTVLSSMPRSGDDRVTLRVASNGTGSSRSAVVAVRDRTVLIRQSGS